MKIGIGIGDIAGAPADIDGIIAQAKRAEADGFASGWFANIFGFDAIMLAALCARETTRIELGTAVVPTFPRHPTAMAQQALTAQAMAGGRFTLGIGLSHQVVIETMLGLSFAKPYSHMKEYLAVLAPLMRTGSVMLPGRGVPRRGEPERAGRAAVPDPGGGARAEDAGAHRRRGGRHDHLDDGPEDDPRAHRPAHRRGGRAGGPAGAAHRRRPAGRDHQGSGRGARGRRRSSSRSTARCRRIARCSIARGRRARRTS